MTTVTIEEAQAKLPELVGGLAPGDELAITRGDRVVARIVGEEHKQEELADPGGKDQARSWPSKAGSAKDKILWIAPDFDREQPGGVAPSAGDGQVRTWPSKAGSGKTEGFWMAPDFDEPLEEFREYME